LWELWVSDLNAAIAALPYCNTSTHIPQVGI
jgi:hypothetical protein